MHYYDVDDRTIGHVLADKAKRIGDRVFLRHKGRLYTYRDVDDITNRYANGFASIGIGRADHVAVMLPNCPELLWVIWGLGKLGAVAVPLNTAAKGDLLSYFLVQSDSTAMCLHAEWLDRAEAALAEAPAVRCVLVLGEHADGVDVAGHEVRALADFERQSACAPVLAEPVRPGDPHLIMYTSGTTGPSKGAVCPHSQGLAVGQQLATASGYRPDDILYTCLPVFHGNALWYTVYTALWAECSVALYPRFSASQFWAQIRESGATVFNCLGAMANILWQLPPSPDDRNHNVRLCMMVPISSALTRGFGERYGVRVTSVFAMTENCAVTVFGPDDPLEKSASCGRVRSHMSVQIVDDDGRVLAPGETGEIRIRPNERGIIMLGYYKKDAATVEATRDLWFHTGDRGYLDEDGYLFFSDRKKEAIRRRGENISAYEVETIICKHPEIVEAAAVPVASELGEDDLMVYLVTVTNATVTFYEVIEFCSKNMAYFMVPRYLQFVDSLPKTASEKVEKYKLTIAAAEHIDELWDREAAGVQVRRQA